MELKDKLVHLYAYVCQCYDTKLCLHCQRMSNNTNMDFTDEELITVYLFGLLQQHGEVKQIYEYTLSHWQDWFPDLPSYQAFNRRINLLTEVFPVLVEDLLEQADARDWVEDIKLLDAMPIILSAQHPDDGKVARALAGKGYCASKKLYYHGLKLHVLAGKCIGSLPLPEYVALSSASAHDLKVAGSILPHLHGCSLYADKIYHHARLKEELWQKQQVRLHTPVKKKKGQEQLTAADRYFSTAVSTVRQPIESLFAWLQDKVKIQQASKVRSTSGALIHTFGKLAAAICILVFNY